MYACVALATDYDCWKETEGVVNVENVIKVFQENVQKVKDIILHTIKLVGSRNWDQEISDLNVSNFVFW